MTRTEKIANGLMMLAKADPNAEIFAEHDIVGISASDPDQGFALTAEEREQLDSYGWFISEEYEDLWCHFV